MRKALFESRRASRIQPDACLYALCESRRLSSCVEGSPGCGPLVRRPTYVPYVGRSQWRRPAGGRSERFSRTRQSSNFSRIQPARASSSSTALSHNGSPNFPAGLQQISSQPSAESFALWGVKSSFSSRRALVAAAASIMGPNKVCLKENGVILFLYRSQHSSLRLRTLQFLNHFPVVALSCFGTRLAHE